MRTFESLLKGGYVPRNFTWLYRKNEETPYLQFCRYNYADAGKKTMIFKPYNRKFTPELLYIHPYFPDYPVVAVQIVKPFPFARAGMVYHLETGILSLGKNMKFTEADIYLYPTFFRPVYQHYGIA